MCSIAVSIRGGTFNLRRACRSFVWSTLSKPFSNLVEPRKDSILCVLKYPLGAGQWRLLEMWISLVGNHIDVFESKGHVFL